jgi:hypothetical protein
MFLASTNHDLYGDPIILTMNKAFHYIFSLIACSMTLNSTQVTGCPQSEFSNGIIYIRCYLPDTEHGYYRGTRFDWSGVMPSLECNGHSYCQQWFEKYDPLMHDAIMGPVESFAPLGYDDAKTGGSFVQIGVGILSKQNESKYSPFKYYPILNPGSWKVRQKSSSIEFIHCLRDSSYSYLYKKTIALVKGKPMFVLTHSLKNTGAKTIETSVYNHNLFVFDHQATGPLLTTKFPFLILTDPQGQRGLGHGDIAEIKGNQIVFNRELVKVKQEQVYSVLHGYGNDLIDYNIQIENHKTGAALKITCDRPISKLVFWASSTVFSPEPYIQIKIKPGEVFTWNIYYQFYTCSIQQ